MSGHSSGDWGSRKILTKSIINSPEELFSGKSGTYADTADVLVTSDCLSQDIESKMVRARCRTCIAHISDALTRRY
jgi:hypothetical protein